MLPQDDTGANYREIYNMKLKGIFVGFVFLLLVSFETRGQEEPGKPSHVSGGHGREILYNGRARIGGELFPYSDAESKIEALAKARVSYQSVREEWPGKMHVKFDPMVKELSFRYFFRPSDSCGNRKGKQVCQIISDVSVAMIAKDTYAFYKIYDYDFFKEDHRDHPALSPSEEDEITSQLGRTPFIFMPSDHGEYSTFTVIAKYGAIKARSEIMTPATPVGEAPSQRDCDLWNQATKDFYGKTLIWSTCLYEKGKAWRAYYSERWNWHNTRVIGYDYNPPGYTPPTARALYLAE